jgi:hypothetical protein
VSTPKPSEGRHKLLEDDPSVKAPDADKSLHAVESQEKQTYSQNEIDDILQLLINSP